MTRHIARYGFIAGLIVILPMVWLTATHSGAPETGLLFGYLTMLVALTAVFLGIKHYRDTVLGGVIRFIPALLLGLGISAVASAVYVAGWEACLAWSGTDFGATYAKAMIAAAHAKGATPEQLQKVTADAQAFAASYGNPLYRLPLTFLEMFPVGILVSIISALLLRNSRLLPARAPA
jgi:hypothetical protein